MIRRGKGIASMFYPVGFTSYPNPSSASVSINSDGSAVLNCGAVDIGQGSTTVLQQIASETLGIPMEQLRMITGDTKLATFDLGTVASRVTYVAGMAVKRACEDAREKLFRAASEKLQFADPEGMVARRGRICLDAFEECSVSIAEVAAHSQNVRGKPITGSATFNPVTTLLSDEDGHGKPYGTHVYATQIAVVEVDDETGEFRVLRIYAVHDCGVAINPMLVKGQIDGGVGMGVGFAMHEAMELREGKVLNDQFTDYVLPTMLDMPEIISEIYERPEPTGPYGAKGVGEPSILPTAPAIANAIYDAVGVIITDLPITPEKVFRALKHKAAESARE